MYEGGEEGSGIIISTNYYEAGGTPPVTLNDLRSKLHPDYGRETNDRARLAWAKACLKVATAKNDEQSQAELHTMGVHPTWLNPEEQMEKIALKSFSGDFPDIFKADPIKIPQPETVTTSRLGQSRIREAEAKSRELYSGFVATAPEAFALDRPIRESEQNINNLHRQMPKLKETLLAANSWINPQ